MTTTNNTRKLTIEQGDKKEDKIPPIDLSVDASSPTSLMDQMQQAPVNFAFYANKLEEAKFETAQLKVSIERRKSQVASELRSTHDKISESRIDKSYYADPRYIELVDKLNSKRRIEGKLQVIVRALESRTAILMSISGLKRQELRQFGATDL